MAIEQAKSVQEVDIVDPDSGGVVTLEVFKDSGGGMFGVDSSFLEQVGDVVPNPLQNGSLIALPQDGEESSDPKSHDLYLINKLLVLFGNSAGKALLKKVRESSGLNAVRFHEIISRAEKNIQAIDE